jgi:hypothetical protein
MQIKINDIAWVNISMSDLENCYLKILEIRKSAFHGV